jgi:hypothetical protein
MSSLKNTQKLFPGLHAKVCKPGDAFSGQEASGVRPVWKTGQNSLISQLGVCFRPVFPAL